MPPEQAVQGTQQIQQVQIVQPVDVSPEDRMARAMGLDLGPREITRSEDGKFAAKDAPAQPGKEEPKQEETAATEEQTEETASEEARPTIEIDPDEKFIDVEEVLAGGEKEVKKYSLNELKAQRMMQADYTRKTQELSAQRKAAEESTAKAVAQERQQYLSTLQTLQAAVIQSAAPELQHVNWNQLATENPAEYVRLSNRQREVAQAVQAIQAEQQNVTQRQAQERQQALAQDVAKSREALQQAIPNWSDETYQKVMKRAVETYGFTPQEIGQVYDHRLIQMLHDANQFREMQAAKPITEKKLVAVPKVTKPGTQQRTADKGRETLNKSRERLRQTGSIDDLADVFGQIIK